MREDAVGEVRRFNRTVTQSVGALNEAFLDRGRPLGHSRVLWEIGASGADVRALRSRLDLDSGYLSRILRALQEEGLVQVDTHPGDGRVRVARLTESGLRERAELDVWSDRSALAVLTPLTEAQQQRLVTAMAEVDRLLQASMIQLGVEDRAIRTPRRASRRTSMSSHADSTVASTRPKAFPPPRTSCVRQRACCSWPGCTAKPSAAPP